jgi:hypothetical protein
MRVAQRGSLTVALASFLMVDLLVIRGSCLCQFDMTLMNRARQNTPLLAVKSGSPFWITEQDAECPYRGVLLGFQVQAPGLYFENESERRLIMSKEQENKDLVGRWFTGFWR